LSVLTLSPDAEVVARVARPGVAMRAPGGLLAMTQRLGTGIRLFGPTPEWFVSLGTDITGCRVPVTSTQ
jgi:hypothetical protein